MDSLVPVTLDDQGRKVTSGLWFDPYTGLSFIDPGNIDIDHLVPPWDNDRRRERTNDLDDPGQLIGVDNGTNQVLSFRPSRRL